ncbi:MAG: LCP family protein [Lachnospiraceae bacterium]
MKKRIPVFICGFVIVCIMAGVLFKYVDERQIFEKDEMEMDDSVNVVEIGGQKYKPKTRIKTYLFMGIDARGKVEDTQEYDGTGQCDVLQLVVIDQNENTYAMLPINRDTITAVKSLSKDGSYIDTSDVQIALAHANGDGKEISCENTVDAVSDYLYGQPIDGYVSLNMDAIKVINHMAGGVIVTIEDDFSESDPSLKMGETVKLTDEQAMHYVHDRKNVADGTNENRMKRQSIYIDEVEKIYREKFSENERFVVELYDCLQDYMLTDLTKKDCSKLAKAMVKNKSLGEIEIKGEVSEDYFGYKQFIPDKNSLEEIIIRLFYDKV